MNHRRALQASTDTGLFIFMVMIAGVVLWTTDEMLDWNLLPDWIDKYTKLLVIILSILAGFAVVISMMCSFAVMAESAAEKTGILAPPLNHRFRLLILIGIILAFGIMFSLHKVDQYRAEARAEEQKQKTEERYIEIQKVLDSQIVKILPLYTSEIKKYLSGTSSPKGDKAIALLLDAIQVSSPNNPAVSVIVTAKTPYSYCLITVLQEEKRQAQSDNWKYLQRQYLTGLPSSWETEAVQSAFERKEMMVAPPKKSGVFINTNRPSSWAAIVQNDHVIGIVMLQGSI